MTIIKGTIKIDVLWRGEKQWYEVPAEIYGQAAVHGEFIGGGNSRPPLLDETYFTVAHTGSGALLATGLTLKDARALAKALAQFDLDDMMARKARGDLDPLAVKALKTLIARYE